MISHILGDMFDRSVTVPAKGELLIAHVCNDVGVWGAGFTGPLAKEFPLSEVLYNRWVKAKDAITPFGLGRVQFIETHTEVGGRVWIANMVAQAGLPSRSNPRPFDRQAFIRCLAVVEGFILAHIHATPRKDFSVLMPRVGTGYGGMHWDLVAPIIEETLDYPDVYVYTLPSERGRFPACTYENETGCLS